MLAEMATMLNFPSETHTLSSEKRPVIRSQVVLNLYTRSQTGIPQISGSAEIKGNALHRRPVLLI